MDSDITPLVEEYDRERTYIKNGGVHVEDLIKLAIYTSWVNGYAREQSTNEGLLEIEGAEVHFNPGDMEKAEEQTQKIYKYIIEGVNIEEDK